MAAPPDPEELAREARLAQAADARARRGDWRQLGHEEATLAGVLERLARDGHGVRLSTTTGPVHGSVVELGPDHVRLDDPVRWRYLRLTTVLTVEAGADHGGEPPSRSGRTFLEALSRRTQEAATLVLADGTTAAGTLLAVGAEVVTLRRPPPTGLLYASSSAVVAVLGDGSG